MREFFRQISPKRAVKDFAGHWSQPNPHRWRVLAVAAAMTFAMFYTLIPADQRAVPPRPDIIYISTFEEGRSEAEIIASNCANQAFKDEIERLLAERVELRKDMYRALGRATFVDVDEIEAELAAERAREEEANAADQPTEQELGLSVEEYCNQAGA